MPSFSYKEAMDQSYPVKYIQDSQLFIYYQFYLLFYFFPNKLDYATCTS